MSECVVRMDHIPRNCLECPLNGQCGIFADWVCTLNSLARKQYPQPFDKGCNILAVLPEPHGRLGDLDKLEGVVNMARIRAMQNGEDTNSYWECADLILQAPTIVPVEEKPEPPKENI